MMEKLLHERLREWEDNGDGTYSVLIENADVRTTKSALMALADEIERCYIPRPRDDKGELWKVDDPCIAKGEEGTVAGFDGEEFINVCSNSSHVHFWFDKRYVKRPTPKVYDADGVEIKVGDTVYRETDGEKLTVESVFADSVCGGCFTSEEFGVGYVAKYFTHERPVFDADGVRIRKGDTVWTVHTANKFTVHGFTDDGAVIVRFGEDADDLTTYAPHGLIHHEPDSLEKLRDDMVMTHDAADEPCSTTEEWIDRLTALIERGAK